MKKIFITLGILLISTVCFAAATFFTNYSTKTATALVTTGMGYYYGYKVGLNGVTPATVTIYDNTGVVSGTEIDPATVYTSWASNDRWQQIRYNPPRRYFTGLYIVISGSTLVTIDFAPD